MTFSIFAIEVKPLAVPERDRRISPHCRPNRSRVSVPAPRSAVTVSTLVTAPGAVSGRAEQCHRSRCCYLRRCRPSQGVEYRATVESCRCHRAHTIVEGIRPAESAERVVARIAGDHVSEIVAGAVDCSRCRSALDFQRSRPEYEGGRSLDGIGAFAGQFDNDVDVADAAYTSSTM